MDAPDEHRLHETIERLTRENAKLRSQLAVARQWNAPPELEHAFQTARGWECLSVQVTDDRSMLILIAAATPGTQRPDEAAGEVWRHLQIAAPPGGGIGPFARARMPRQLLGYLRDQGGRAVFVLNRDLRRGQVSRAARMLRSNARTSRPATRLLGLSLIPTLILCLLFHKDVSEATDLTGKSPGETPAVHHATEPGMCVLQWPERMANPDSSKNKECPSPRMAGKIHPESG